ncbi:hypothetical protein [Brachybacterium sp.]|uniref:hypothetical protein n=1 Tax=Brachybacterium sp. TaxID=1891286 RepID=UPI002ECFBDB7
MMNRWGNDDHGPGGDPSWLGGKDRGSGGAPESDGGGWSSGFSSDVASESSGSDFAHRGSDSAARWQAQEAEQMAPRFGERADGDARTSSGGEDSPWMAGFAGQESAGSGSQKSGLSKLLGAVVPIFALVIFGIVAVNIFGGFSGGFGFWWMFLFIGIPLLSKVVRALRKHLDG